MSNIQPIIKSIQKIMWQDKGVNGDAIRIEQLVWMLFLKIFDDRESNLELINPKYKSPIPEKYRYRNWALNEEGMTGEELFNFIDKELFPALKNLEISIENTNGFIVKSIFLGICFISYPKFILLFAAYCLNISFSKSIVKYILSKYVPSVVCHKRALAFNLFWSSVNINNLTCSGFFV